MTPTAQPEIIKLPSDQDASGPTFGAEEIAALTEVLQSGTLITTKGKFGRTLKENFAKRMGVKYAYACNSGSAAVHVAIAAINPNPGDEIVTTSITDMGALTPIVFQGAIPVFADVDPKTLNVTAETIEKVLSEKTKAIIVTHLFGNPCEMQAIKELPNFISVYGTNGTLHIGWGASKYKLNSNPDWIQFGKGYDKVQAFRSKIENFANAIHGTEELLTKPEDALASVEVIEAAYKSLNQNLWQPITSQWSAVSSQ
jgi:hypothetical protein